jgi:mannosyltransferase OCH1-like enzyme
VIPRIIHRIWLGDAPIPETFQGFGEEWARLHPDWTMWLWTDENVNVDGLANRADYLIATEVAKRSDLLRLELLVHHGGFYVDMDMEPLQPFDVFLDHGFVAGYEDGHHLCNAVMGAEVGHPFVKQLVSNVPDSISANFTKPLPQQTGPSFLTREWRALGPERRAELDMVGYAPVVFYPVHHTEKERLVAATRTNPATWAIHHWAASWLS